MMMFEKPVLRAEQREEGLEERQIARRTVTAT